MYLLLLQHNKTTHAMTHFQINPDNLVLETTKEVISNNVHYHH